MDFVKSDFGKNIEVLRTKSSKWSPLPGFYIKTIYGQKFSKTAIVCTWVCHFLWSFSLLLLDQAKSNFLLWSFLSILQRNIWSGIMQPLWPYITSTLALNCITFRRACNWLIIVVLLGLLRKVSLTLVKGWYRTL